MSPRRQRCHEAGELVEDYDNIVLLMEGRCGQGTHAELMQRFARVSAKFTIRNRARTTMSYRVSESDANKKRRTAVPRRTQRLAFMAPERRAIAHRVRCHPRGFSRALAAPFIIGVRWTRTSRGASSPDGKWAALLVALYL